MIPWIKRRKKKSPLTKGGALIEARKVVGPSGHVICRDKSYAIGTFDENGFQFVGDWESSWERALSNARKICKVAA